MPLSPARKIAFDVLGKVSAGGYANDLLRAETTGLSSRDAGLASELVYGVLRFRSQLDHLITHFSGRGPARLDSEVRLALQLGIYQLRYLGRIPRHAAVTESVDLVKRARKRSAAGLVNAVLRKVNREPVVWPNRSVELSLPPWLLESWERQFGAEAATLAATEFLKPPNVYIRIPKGREREAAGLDIETTGVPRCYRLRSGDAPGFRQQDISSQAVVPLLELERCQGLLDLCAAPGNKSAQAMESDLFSVAADISLRRLRAMNIPGAAIVQLDGTRELPFHRKFERVLVDAPCSGTGTAGRNPEIKWRVQPEDLDGFRARQVSLLRQGLSVLEPAGRLVYSTCSLEREENEDVVEEVLGGAAGGFRLMSTVHRIPGKTPGDGFFAAVIARTGSGREEAAMLPSN